MSPPVRTPIRSRYYLRILTALACGVFVFVFYFVNGVQQQVKLQVDGAAAAAAAADAMSSSMIEYRPVRCALPIYWAGQSSKYTVLYNFVPADTTVEYNASVTYTTHGTNRFLAHVEQIARRWNGPVSLAVYAPATDFMDSLRAIQYLRQCCSPQVRQFTTFHLFFDAGLKPPGALPCSLEDAVPPTAIDCETFVFPNRTYQAENNLPYPVNVARNIARISAQTYYVLPSDIELYPSANLIPMFLDMVDRIKREAELKAAAEEAAMSTSTTADGGNATTTAVDDNDVDGKAGTLGDKDESKSAKNGSKKDKEESKKDKDSAKKDKEGSKKDKDSAKKDKDECKKDKEGSKKDKDSAKMEDKDKDGANKDKDCAKSDKLINVSGPTVYILPIFEVDKALTAPETKAELLSLMAKEKVVPFHKFVCPECHRVPKQDQWLKHQPANDTLGVLYATKRHKPFQNWEPIFIGTNDEPLYDERLNWEGMSDKMTQAFEMCLLDYNFAILDNAFLVHAPGIKHYSKSSNQWRNYYVTQNSKLRKQIKKELNTKYEPNSKCSL